MTSATPPTPSPTVLLTVAEGTATVTLNRPEAMNSLDEATRALLLETLTAVAADDAVRCVVLQGTGRAFCTGQDLKEHVTLLETVGSDEALSCVERQYNPVVTALATMPKPVIAAVNGVAAGAGASLAFACDLRIVADTAGFNLAFAGVGLSCDTGASYFLPGLVGAGRALELLYLPRTIPAAEAAELGLANRVVPAADLDAEVAALAARLASGPTVAYASMRRAVRHAERATLPQALALESELMLRTGATRDHGAAVAAFVAKQKPVFEGR
ncbi:enoyl-CoA hydratase/isomerase family protein [Nocardioides sp.]|uniref:enoyl-CoA hydratase/isomerase family protein n=1 Tax=Nocardioides sp. TaxID=35761 RepID=UPI003518A0DE